MPRRIHAAIVVPIALALLPTTTFSQASRKSTSAAASSTSQTGLDLAEKGHCREALPLLKKSAPLAADKQTKLKMGLAITRCALSLDQVESAVHALLWLNREFPNDPDVLYVTTHAYSDLSARASLQLARTAASSYQAHELNAESLEMQGKWDSTAADARKEFEDELKIDPNNAGAEYVLGELSSQAQQWDEAIQHFSRAAKLDAGFSEAVLGLGSSYVSAGKFVEAIPPLEGYVKLQPGNPAGHYQLAIAYSRAGRKDDAKREAALQKETTERLEQEN